MPSISQAFGQRTLKKRAGDKRGLGEFSSPRLRLQSGKKRTAQRSAHPQKPYLRAQVIKQAAMVCNGWKPLETAVDCDKLSKTRMSLG